MNKPIDSDAERFGYWLARARIAAGLSQESLANRAKMSRLNIVRLERNRQIARWKDVTRLAAALKVPLQHFITGRNQPTNDFSALAYELYHLGIVDIEITDAQISGSFRRREEVVPLALQGNQPPASIIEAIPFVLSRWGNWRTKIMAAFADSYDHRIRNRLAWLAEISLALGRRSRPPYSIVSVGDLESIIKLGVPTEEADSLGHPGVTSKSPIWRRWDITYAADMATFLRRAEHLAALTIDEPKEADSAP